MPFYISDNLYKTQWELYSQHLEEYAAAFIKHTNLPPDKVVMKVELEYTANGYKQTIWFEEKKDEPG